MAIIEMTPINGFVKVSVPPQSFSFVLMSKWLRARVNLFENLHLEFHHQHHTRKFLNAMDLQTNNINQNDHKHFKKHSSLLILLKILLKCAL